MNFPSIVQGSYPTIHRFATRYSVSIAVVLALFEDGRAPKRLGMAHRGLFGEPELLRAWCIRNGVPFQDALPVFKRGLLPDGIARTNTAPSAEWFQSTPGIRNVLHAQAEHGHTLIRMIHTIDGQIARLQHWSQSYRSFVRQLEEQRSKLRALYAEHLQLRNTIKRAQDAYRRGDIPLTLADMDDLKQRLFGADLVAMEMAERRKRWRKHRGKKTAVPQLRQAHEASA